MSLLQACGTYLAHVGEGEEGADEGHLAEGLEDNGEEGAGVSVVRGGQFFVRAAGMLESSRATLREDHPNATGKFDLPRRSLRKLDSPEQSNESSQLQQDSQQWPLDKDQHNAHKEADCSAPLFFPAEEVECPCWADDEWQAGEEEDLMLATATRRVGIVLGFHKGDWSLR